jgi:hypothetical protein
MSKECPVCELMNTEEADTCRHCGTAFFFELECLDPRFDDPGDELVVVGRYGNVIDASFVKGVLQENNIDACIPEDLTPHIFPLIETVTVRVAAKNVEAAKQIIADYKGP